MRVSMVSYYVNRNPEANGNHEVHTEFCERLPEASSRFRLGICDNHEEALEKARRFYGCPSRCSHCLGEYIAK